MAEHVVRDDETFRVPAALRPYRSAAPMAQAVAGLAMAYVALTLATQTLSLMGRVVPVLDSVSALVAIPLVVMTLLFFRRLTLNLLGLGVRDPDWPPTWAWLGWLVPIAWWIVPYLVARQLWKTSDPDATQIRTWRSVPVPGWLTLWWLLWTTAGVLNWAVITWGLVHGQDPTVTDPDARGLNAVIGFGTLLGVVALFPYLRLVRTLPERQDERRGRVAPGSPENATGTF